MFLVICQVSLRYINKLQNLIRTSPFILAKTIFCWLSTHRTYFTAALCNQMTFNCWTLFRATIITACACRSRIGCVFLCFNVTYFRDTWDSWWPPPMVQPEAFNGQRQGQKTSKRSPGGALLHICGEFERLGCLRGV